jgi:regulatory protein
MISLRQRAIRLLAQREHTRLELQRKLSVHGAADEIDTVLAELEITQLQSDARFAEAYVRSHAPRLGAARLRQTLRTKGVDAELIDAQLSNESLPDELERARALWVRKFVLAPVDSKEWARQARFLQSRGFSADLIRRLLKELPE